MKTRFIALMLLFIPLLSFSINFDPEGLYMITCIDTNSGGIETATGQYPLLYNADAEVNTNAAFWTIKEESWGKYSFKNSVTNQYIKYNPEKSDQKSIEMVNSLDGNNTLFTINGVYRNGNYYYTIESVADPAQFINKRNYAPYPVGTYGGKYSDNEIFYFREKDDFLMGDRGKLYNYVESFTLNDKELVPCTRENIYYFSIPLNKMNTNVEQTIKFQLKNSNYRIKIEGQEITDGANYVFENITANKTYKIQITENSEVLSTETLVFTGLPIVQLYSDGNYLSTVFSLGKIRVHEPDKAENAELHKANLRYRGASATGFDKKSFAIKLKDENGIDKTNVSFFGLREDNSWILDAMAVDRSRMRNRVATDIWNEFSSLPYHFANENNIVNATRGQYVEVFLDDQYWGLYCMTEKIDRKQLKLERYNETTKSVNGVLYKAVQWTYSVMMGYDPDRGPNPSLEIPVFDNNTDYWEAYEVKYPDLGDGQNIDWQPLYDVVSFVAHSSNADFKASVENVMDMPVWIDYYLLMDLILATDNHGKNAYLYMYNKNSANKKMGIAPWDMDGVFGRRWGGTEVAADQNYNTYIINNEHGEHYLYRRLRQMNAADFDLATKARYNQLRNNHFKGENIIKRFTEYMDMFNKSGASVREKARWDGSNRVDIDFEEEMNYITTWVQTRVAYLDNQYGTQMKIPTLDINIPKTLTYGDAATDYSVTSTNTSTELSLKSEHLTFSNGKINIKKAGQGFIRITQPYTNQYAYVDTIININIVPKTLYAKADDKQRNQSWSNPEFTVTYDGYAYYDGPGNVIKSHAVASTEATKDSPAGTYPITVSGGRTNNNYVFEYVSGTLTIFPSTDIKDQQLEIDLYPNPVLSLLTVNNLTQGTTVQIFTENGICLYMNRTLSTKITLNLSGYASGRYIIKAGDKSSIVIKQ